MLKLLEKTKKVPSVPAIITLLLVLYGVALLTDDTNMLSIL